MLKGKLRNESVSEKEEVAPTVKELLVSMSVDKDKINRICNQLIQLNKTGAITRSMLDDFEGFIVVKVESNGNLKFTVDVDLNDKFYKEAIVELCKKYDKTLKTPTYLEDTGELIKTVLENIKVKELVEYISKIYTEWEWNVEGVFDVIENIRVSCNRDDYFAININNPESHIGLTIHSHKETYSQNYTKQHLDKAEDVIIKNIKEFLDNSEITIDDITHNYSDSDIVYSSIVSPCIFTVKDLKIFNDRNKISDTNKIKHLRECAEKFCKKSDIWNIPKLLKHIENCLRVDDDAVGFFIGENEYRINYKDSNEKGYSLDDLVRLEKLFAFEKFEKFKERIDNTAEAFSKLSASINLNKEELSRLKELSGQKPNPICEFVDDCDEDEWDAIILKDIITRYNDGEFLEYKEELSFTVLGLLCEDVDLESVGEIVEYMYNNYENNDIPDYAIEFARVVSQVMEMLGGCED